MTRVSMSEETITGESLHIRTRRLLGGGGGGAIPSWHGAATVASFPMLRSARSWRSIRTGTPCESFRPHVGRCWPAARSLYLASLPHFLPPSLPLLSSDDLMSPPESEGDDLPAPTRSLNPEEECKLFVGNLNFATEDEDLANIFGEFGAVISAEHVADRFDPMRKVSWDAAVARLWCCRNGGGVVLVLAVVAVLLLWWRRSRQPTQPTHPPVLPTSRPPPSSAVSVSWCSRRRRARRPLWTRLTATTWMGGQCGWSSSLLSRGRSAASSSRAETSAVARMVRSIPGHVPSSLCG